METKKERWRPIKGCEGIYSISNLGNVYSRPRRILDNTGIYRNIKGKLLSKHLDKDGYVIVGLSINKVMCPKRVHILVATAFIPNPLNKEQVNHKDLNKENNEDNNLEWNTALENIQHAHRYNAYSNKLAAESKPVIVFKGAIEVAKYPSIAATGRALDVPSSTISDYLKSNRLLYGRAKGYHFQFQT